MRPISVWGSSTSRPPSLAPKLWTDAFPLNTASGVSHAVLHITYGPFEEGPTVLSSAFVAERGVGAQERTDEDQCPNIDAKTLGVLDLRLTAPQKD